MRIIINTAHQRFGGAVQVALSFVYECRKFQEHEYHVFVGPGLKKSLKESDFPSNFHFYHFDFGVIGLRKSFTINKTLRKAEEGIRPDVIIATSGPSYFHSRAPQIIGFNLPLYIYPESPFVKNLGLKARLRMAVKKLLHFYFFRRDSHAYVVQTDDVNKRVRKALHTEKVYTVSNTHNGFYLNWKKYQDRLPARREGQIRFITVSAWYPHKNLEIIPQVIDELKRRGKENFQFIVTLEQQQFEAHFAHAKSEHLLNAGTVLPPECPSLYNECDVMFLPTLAECFSASYPEAMIMEKPVITTDLGFARSICGEAALYYRAMDPVSAADRIEQLIHDRDLWRALIRKGKERLKEFDNAEERAGKYLSLCQKTALG